MELFEGSMPVAERPSAIAEELRVLPGGVGLSMDHPIGPVFCPKTGLYILARYWLLDDVVTITAHGKSHRWRAA